MAGIYLHIPFCRQACHYCDFHFATSHRQLEPMVNALIQELESRKDYLEDAPVETIYFGGGTPSLLEPKHVDRIFETIFRLFPVVERPEITLEANPDDLKGEYLKFLTESPVNRLSIGVQSFLEEDLKTMNRAHSAAEAHACIDKCRDAGFDDLSIDLMYGLPDRTKADWIENLEKALQYRPEHLSAYCLTVETGTALAHQVKKGKVTPADDQAAKEQMAELTRQFEAAGYEHYEISNLAREGRYARHNTAYWFGKSYLGIGPSAHSFNGQSRQWNVANNVHYLKALNAGESPAEKEELTFTDRFNERVLLSLRTIWGLDLENIERDFGKTALHHLRKESRFYLQKGHLEERENRFFVTSEGKSMADRIASDLFALENDLL
ncbi:MAG: radical SAM family heme chaperone HemW [Salibacteraceae bacterium]